LPISIFDDLKKFRINLWSTTSIRKSFSTTKISFPDSIEIDDNVTFINAESPMNWTFRGITIDWNDEDENDSDSIRTKHEFDRNVIDESDLQCAKQVDLRMFYILWITFINHIWIKFTIDLHSIKSIFIFITSINVDSK
jgi:hypothetical protein